MTDSHQLDCLKCPFCLNHIEDAKPGKKTCPECSAEFEIDDRLECIFVNTKKVRLPLNGTVCGVCGLVQVDERATCLFCGNNLTLTMQ
jgi:hypothetical protein